jgi:hypothetical protein
MGAHLVGGVYPEHRQNSGGLSMGLVMSKDPDS